MRLFPVILTLEQVRHYQLPRTPIKETERRRESFEGRHGEGAVELDALEALYPGQLEMILSQYVEGYYDTTLAERVHEARAQVEQGLSELWQQVTGRFREDVAVLHEEYTQLEQDFGARMEGYANRVRTTWQAIQSELNVTAPDIVPWLPSVYRGTEVGEGLLNTDWDYLEQIDVYKLFQGRE